MYMDPVSKILNTATALFRQYGFKAITMDDIASRAGISKKTLYQHFANKHEIVKESVVSYKCHMEEECRSIINSSANAVEAMIRTQMMMDQVYKQTNPTSIYELQRYHPDAYAVFREKLQEQDVELMKSNILQGISEGLYRASVKPDLMAKYRLETALMIFQPNLLVNDRYDMMSVGQEIFEHFMYGIMTAKGEKLFQKYKEQYLKSPSTI